VAVWKALALSWDRTVLVPEEHRAYRRSKTTLDKETGLMTNEPLDSPSEETPTPPYRDRISNSNNPMAIVTDTFGVVVLGIVSVVLTIALVRVLGRNRELESRNRR